MSWACSHSSGLSACFRSKQTAAIVHHHIIGYVEHRLAVVWSRRQEFTIASVVLMGPLATDVSGVTMSNSHCMQINVALG